MRLESHLCISILYNNYFITSTSTDICISIVKTQCVLPLLVRGEGDNTDQCGVGGIEFYIKKLNPWHYSSEEPRLTEVVAAR